MKSRNQWLPVRKAAGSEVKFLKFEGGQITIFIFSLILGFLVFLSLNALGATTLVSFLLSGMTPVSTTLFLVAFVYQKPKCYFGQWLEWKLYQGKSGKQEFIRLDDFGKEAK